jgi:hypothetical protein
MDTSFFESRATAIQPIPKVFGTSALWRTAMAWTFAAVFFLLRRQRILLRIAAGLSIDEAGAHR